MALFPKVGRTQPRLRFAWYTVIALLLFGIILHLLPFYYMITTSFKTTQETFAIPPTLWPQEPSTKAWDLILSVTTANSSSERIRNLLPQPMHIYFRNSMVQVLGAMALSLPVTAFAAYANSKLQRGRSARWFFLFFIGTLMLPFAVTLIPSFLLTRNFPFPTPNPPLLPGSEDPFPTLRIWNTPWAIIIPAGFNAFNFLLFKGFFDTIPNSIIQAARVDGGSEFNIFRRIVFPMSIPVFAVAAWFQFGALWDSFLWPLVVLQSTDVIPMSVAINNLIQAFQQAGMTNADQAAGASLAFQEALNAGLSWPGLMVLGILQTIPVFLMFIICREYLLKGVRLRGLK
ncbi:MAG: carbohydrate ABC transporter permease [Anaerolineae bacterium]|nr:carbohydrate ABC transporter permease [Anaerolineae bacterium]